MTTLPTQRRRAREAAQYRFVTVQDGNAFVSSIPVDAEEARGMLEMDSLLHRAAGWKVARGEGVVVATRGDVVRLVATRPVDPTDRATPVPNAA